MNSIQIITDYQKTGIIQMLWAGHISLRTIRLSIAELNRILKSQTEPINLVITVDTTTYLPTGDIVDLPQLHDQYLRGWMVVGNDRQLNRAVTGLMTQVAP